MKVLVLHEQVCAATARPDELDVLAQADFAERSLREAGLEVARAALDGEHGSLAGALELHHPDVVLNLVESLGGSSQRIAEVPARLEELGVPFTGASSRALRETSDKLATKLLVREHGLPTPPWLELGGACRTPESRHETRTWIIKPSCEDGSVGIDDAALTTAQPDAVLCRLERETRAGRPCFAEAYIEGRELNVSVLVGKDGARALPVAEIVFDAFPPGKPRIVGYAAKWDSASFEYRETPRRFDFAPSDAGLLRSLAQLACACSELFELGGYARVDFRVDARQQPWILEVNANPCLAPDAGFVHAAARAGLAPAELFGFLVESARSSARARAMAREERGV